MSLQNLSKSAVRVGKNYIKGYTDTQIKVREATSNDPWGPSASQMHELAQLSHNHTDFIEMMEILDKRLNDKGKNWRHVFKALSVLDYLLHAGSENVWMYFHDNIYIVKTLKEFQYVDDAHLDQGVNVRQKAKEITSLLMDESRMRTQRRARSNMNQRTKTDPTDYSDAEGRRKRQAENDQRSREDRELQQALEESRRMAEEEERRKKAAARDDEDFQKALRMSKEEEEKKSNLINLEESEQNPYGTMQPQYTSFNPYMQYQPTGFNPFFQAQMQQQELLQQQYLAQQEYQRQLALQNAAQQYQYMMTQQQQQQQQPLMPQPTSFGSNNPWLNPNPSPAAPAPEPAQEVEEDDKTDTLISLDVPAEPAPKPKPAGPPKVKTSNAHPELDRLLASGDGVDTFGNTGEMRMGPNYAALNRRMHLQRTGQTSALGDAAFGSHDSTAMQPQHTSNPFSL